VEDHQPVSGANDPDEHREDIPAETVAFGSAVKPGRLTQWLRNRSPRQMSAMLVGSTALLGVVVLITVVSSGKPSTDRADPEQPQSGGDLDAAAVGPPANPDVDGRVWIGYDGVMVSVPRAWVQHRDGCGFTATAPLHDWVRTRCPTGTPPTSLLWLHHPSPVDAADGTTTITGMQVGQPRRVDGRFTQSVGPPSGEMAVVISTASRRELIRLVGSARPIPPDCVSIPDLVGNEPISSIRAVADLGLVPQVNHNSGTVLPRRTVVVDQSPRPGLVVAPGTPVSFSVLPADAVE
jgi:hypothetical protein